MSTTTSESHGAVLALDVGQRRIGVAVGERSTGLAFPLEVVQRRAARDDLDRMLMLIDERGVDTVVVGVPIREDGSAGRVARDARFLGGKLGALRPQLRVEYVDEAYTTSEAEQRLHDRGMDARRQRTVIDAVAAQVLLEGWLAGAAAALPARGLDGDPPRR